MSPAPNSGPGASTRVRDRASTRARPPRPAARSTAWLIFGVVLLGTVLQPTGRFLFDARGYWTAAGSLIGSADPVPAGFWDLRGVSSAIVFVPAQLLSRLLGADAAGFAVLFQNSVLIASVAAFLVPALLAPWTSLSVAGRWVSAIALAGVTRGFAPYPLVDLYPAVALLVAVWLLYRRPWWRLAAAGLLAGTAFNIRPAYLVPVLLLAVVLTWYHRVRALAAALGAFLALVPQALYLGLVHHSLGFAPVASTALVGLQTSYASYVVRYDTVIESPLPQQFFCSPTMASAIGEPPLSIGSLAATFLSTLPHSAAFAVEKVGAALHWPLSIPYLVPHTGVNAVVAVLVTLVAVLGVARLVTLRPGRADSLHSSIARPALAALAIGTTATLVSAATEARFALLLVLIGAIGCGLLVDRPLVLRGAGRDRRDVVTAATSLVVLSVLLIAGWQGLAHPAPPGGVVVETCAELPS